jgi:multidrug efflux pump subunit AcrB
LSAKVAGANRSFEAGQIRDEGRQISIMAGQTLQSPSEIGNILITARDGRPVYVRDVAKILLGADSNEWRVTNVIKHDDLLTRVPAVSLAIAKRPGTNAVVISEHIIQRLEQLKGEVIPQDITVEVVRNYGETANEKANELLFHLGLATLSIVFLVAISIGLREALVVAVVIPTTILLTLFAARVMAALNASASFALIFSIGICHDAIVVIENVRHWAMGDSRSRTRSIDAVAEVGNPTIAATLTVVADAACFSYQASWALYESHSGQCVGGNDLLILRRRHCHTLAHDKVRQEIGRPWPRNIPWRDTRANICCRGSPNPQVTRKVMGFPGRRWYCDTCLSCIVL